MKFKNKTYKILPMILVLSVVLVSAGVLYYATFSATFNVTPAIEIEGNLEQPLGDFIIGKESIEIEGTPITITSNANSEEIITITDNSEDYGNVEVSYTGSLTMVEKDTSNWEILEGGDSETITYTIVGDEFVINDIPEGYTLIYYPNLVSGWYSGISIDVTVLNNGINTIGNLPDTSIDVGDDYCGNGYNPTATQCVGAKLWLILGDETTALAKLDSWTMADTLFETELIQYNAGGEIVMSADSELTITPVYTISPINGGQYPEYTITTEIQ